MSQRKAIALCDPRLRQPAAALAAGHLVADHALAERERPTDGRAAYAEATVEHEQRREASVSASVAALPLHRRLRADRQDLEAAYDMKYLYVCEHCAVPRNVDDDRATYVSHCRWCGGSLVPWFEADPTPAVDDSVARITARRDRLVGRQ